MDKGGAMSERTIELTRTTDASPSAVFRALTDAGELSRWWTTTAESDPRTGGSFSYRFEFEDQARNHTYEGAYHEVVEGERISYPWHAAVGETRVDVSVRPNGGGTRLTLTHSRLGNDAEADEAGEPDPEG